MTEPTHIRSSRMEMTSVYHVEITAGELTRIYEVWAADFPSAENKALKLWFEDEARAAKGERS